MFWNLLKTTFRNLIKNKAFILLNVLGLTIGLAVFSAIVLFIQYEFSYEKTHKHIDNIYRIEQFWTGGGQKQNMCGTPPPLCPVLINDFPEIEKATPISIWRSIIVENEKHEKMRESTILFVDKDFLEMFTINRISGDPDGSLSEPYTGVISRKTAEKYFGDKNPVGKTLKINNQFAVEIRTVVEDLPENTHLKFNILISFPTLRELFGDEVVTNDWYSNWIRNYVMVAKNADITGLNKKIRFYLKNYQGEESENELYLKPLSRIHLYSTVNDEIARVGDINNIKVFSAIGIFILLIACINFINLSTAFSSDRAREVGVRKITGASKGLLMNQFLGESILLAVISMHIGLILLEALLPYFNMLVDRNLELNYFNNWTFSGGMLFISFLVGMIAGFYPAVILSSFHPAIIIKGNLSRGSKTPVLRRILVILQFFVSITLIICSILVLQQLNFMKNKDLGFDKDHVLSIGITNSEMSKVEVFRNEVLKNPGVIEVGTSDYLPMASTNWTGFSWEGAQEDEWIKMNINYVDFNFLNVYGIKIIDGRTFTREMALQDQKYVVLNETAVRNLGWDGEAVGKIIYFWVDYRSRDGKRVQVAGVVKDYHFLSKHYPITPLIMPLINDSTAGGRISVKITPYDMDQTLKFMEHKFKEVFPEEIWDYSFTDDTLDAMYDTESKLGKLVLFFAGLAIVIASLGLFGLISFTTTQRTKEIGIRKVLGAPVRSIFFLISREFMVLLVLANLIAWPVSYLFINKWLQNFQYQISIGFIVFFIAGILSLLIANLTAGFRVIRTANTNPANSLRYE